MACRFLIVLSGLTVLGLLLLACESAVYNVGGTAGWDISSDLPSWAAGKVFYVGDILLFQFSQYHSLNQVDKDGFDACNASKPLLTGSRRNATVVLRTAGEKYFICGVVSHCLGGMKLQLNALKKPSPLAPSPQPELTKATSSTLPQRPASTSDLPPEASGSSEILRMCRLFRAMCWSMGALIWVLF